jgi:rubredoxin
MSCMTHQCEDCGELVFNNDTGPDVCPKCGGEMVHSFDE